MLQHGPAPVVCRTRLSAIRALWLLRLAWALSHVVFARTVHGADDDDQMAVCGGMSEPLAPVKLRRAALVMPGFDCDARHTRRRKNAAARQPPSGRALSETGSGLNLREGPCGNPILL